ncbi:MAG: mercuric transporter MerT family protein, partial [Saprospiraceae bacterium]|nr:mercuric transporter MerT family protein [Saprospiraceae bacterium]
MNKKPSSIVIGLVTAMASSLCCIAPLIAILAGSSSLASSFAWIDPWRPWLIGLTVVALSHAWYQQLR